MQLITLTSKQKEDTSTNYERQKMIVDGFNKHNIGNLNKVDGIECEKCSNRGYSLSLIEIENSEYPETVHVECECGFKRKVFRKVKSLGLETPLKLNTFERYKTENPFQRDIKTKAIGYTAGFKNWFFISGQVGSGKTHILLSILNEAINQGKSFEFFKWGHDNQRLKALVMNALDYDFETGKYKTTDVLFLDDLFKTKKEVNAKGQQVSSFISITDADVKLAYTILDYRYTNRLATVITSEHAYEQINRIIDESIASRIYEMSKGNLFYISPDAGKDYRTK